MRRAALALLLAMVFGSLPLTALADPDLRSELVAPPGTGWQEEPAGTSGDGPMSLEDVAQTFTPHAYGRTMLHTAAFQAGYRRTWTQPSSGLQVTERDYLFGSAFGAGLWLGTVKGADRSNPDWRQTYDTSSLENSFGGYRVLSDGTYQTLVEFVPGDRVYAVIVSSPDGPQQSLAMGLASQIDATAPQEVVTSSGAAAFGRVALIAIGAVLAVGLVAALVIVLAIRSSRRPREPVYPAGPVLSPDGRWWWDGFRWQPVPPSAPTPPASPWP